MFRKRDAVQRKTPEQVALMRASGLVTARTLQALRAAVRPGISTLELDRIAEDSIRSAGAAPNFLGYHGFPASICTSVNDEVVHGIPSDRVLQDGDVVSIDCGAVLEGWHSDSAITVPVGSIGDADEQLLRVTEDAMWAGFAAARIGGRLSDVSHAVESTVRAAGDYGVVEEYVGHGIGTEMHQEPSVLNYGPPGRGPRLERGVVLAVEPMVNAGGRATRVLGDDWTVVTADGSRSAHFEHTFTLTPTGPWVLTALDGGAARLAALGVTCGGPGA